MNELLTTFVLRNLKSVSWVGQINEENSVY